MRLLPSASKLQLAFTCIGSAVLPGDGRETDDAADGKRRGEVLRKAIVTGEMPTDKEDRDWVDVVLEVAGDMLFGSRGEVALAVDPSTTARELGENIDRVYEGVSPDEFYGTADFLSVSAGHALVVDLKTWEAPPPEVNWQLKVLALAVARLHGAEVVHVALLHAPRATRPWWRKGRFDAFDLAEIAQSLEVLRERIFAAWEAFARGVTPRLNSGKHCTYCPAKRSCPARVEIVKRMAGEPEELVRDTKKLVRAETVSLARARRALFADLLKELDAALYAWAEHEGPIPDLSDPTKVWGPHDVEHEEIDAKAAHMALAAKFGASAANEAMTFKTSKTAIADTVKGLTPRGKKQAAADAFLDELRASGIVTTKTVREVGTYTLKSPKSSGLPAAGALLPPASPAPVLSEGPKDPDPPPPFVELGDEIPDPDPFNGVDADLGYYPPDGEGP